MLKRNLSSVFFVLTLIVGSGCGDKPKAGFGPGGPGGPGGQSGLNLTCTENSGTLDLIFHSLPTPNASVSEIPYEPVNLTCSPAFGSGYYCIDPQTNGANFQAYVLQESANSPWIAYVNAFNGGYRTLSCH